jgi:hypothetical protein
LIVQTPTESFSSSLFLDLFLDPSLDSFPNAAPPHSLPPFQPLNLGPDYRYLAR